MAVPGGAGGDRAPDPCGRAHGQCHLRAAGRADAVRGSAGRRAVRRGITSHPRRPLGAFLAVVVAATLAWSAPAAAADRYLCERQDGLQQLRIYEINRDNRGPFHDRFRDHALRIMQRHGFTVLDMWESDTGDRLQFVYLLSWPDEATMEARWEAFLADGEWIAIKRRTAAESGQLVREANGQPLARLSYSPACDPARSKALPRPGAGAWACARAPAVPGTGRHARRPRRALAGAWIHAPSRRCNAAAMGALCRLGWTWYRGVGHGRRGCGEAHRDPGIDAAVPRGDRPDRVRGPAAGPSWPGGKTMSRAPKGDAGPRNRLRPWIWGAAAGLPLVPGRAGRFVPPAGVDWTALDFVAMGVLLALACGLYELGARASANAVYRLAFALAVLTGFLTVWVNLAVGMLGGEHDAINLGFAGVLLVAAAGATIARLEPAGMARAMAVAGVAQLLVVGVAVPMGFRPVELALTACFAVPWFASALLFGAAARRVVARR